MIEYKFKTEDGQEVDLGAVMKEAAMEGLKDFGLPTDSNGKFDAKAIQTPYMDEKSQKKAALEVAANFIKSITVPVEKHAAMGIKAIDTTGGSFGSVVPTELSDEILEQSRRWTVIRRYAFVFQMSGKLTVPKEGTLVTAYWVAENAAITESTPTTGSITLDDHGVAALIKISWKLLNTSSQNLVNFVARLAGKAITDKEEAAFVNGDGSGKPTGITTETLTSVAQAGANLAYTDILALYYALPAGYRQNAQFLTSSKGARLMHSLVDTAGRPLFPVGQSLDQLFGKPLIESEDVVANLGAGTNETFVIFGDFSNYWIKDGSDLEMATQDAIENLQTKVVVYKYVDGKCVNTAAFRKLTGVK